MKFELSKKEIQDAHEFMNERVKDGAYEGAIGGRFSVEFTITGLGNVVVIKDAITKSELDITDYDTW